MELQRLSVKLPNIFCGMKNRWKICQIISSIFLVILIYLSNIAPATAEATYPYYFYWDFINVDINVQSNGNMLITENQKYVFTKPGENQRYRYIPLDKVDKITEVSVLEDNRKINFESGIENNQLWIKWKHPLNPPEEHIFTLKYRVIGGLSFDNETYKVDWKAIFQKRNASIRGANVKITFPENLSKDIQIFRSYGVSTKAEKIDTKTVEFVSKKSINTGQEIEVEVILYSEQFKQKFEKTLSSIEKYLKKIFITMWLFLISLRIIYELIAATHNIRIKDDIYIQKIFTLILCFLLPYTVLVFILPIPVFLQLIFPLFIFILFLYLYFTGVIKKGSGNGESFPSGSGDSDSSGDGGAGGGGGD